MRVSARAAPAAPAARARPRDFLALTKPRIVGLLVVTGLGSAVVAAGGWPGLAPVLAVAVGGALAAGGGGAMNAALEADLDARMARTRGRPVPAGRISPGLALAFGLALEVAAFALITALTNALAAALALGGAVWYALVYTLWLKRRTSWNIVVGGAAGSFPPLVGWAAVTGTLHPTAWALAAAVFFWTPPHFWALATLLREDYRRAAVPMLPVVADPRTVATRMLRYAGLTLAATLAPLAWGGLGVVHGAVAAASGLWFAGECLNHRRHLSRATAGRVFWASGLYLLLLFAGAALDRAVAG
ncbi:MAG TPA: heme o synthase [Actinomycetota bacterium]|nr:heme o synthase [Actinomycetota bacterium]